MSSRVLTSATALTVDTPAQATPNAAITVTGTYQGSPQALDFNFGAGWIAASSPVFNAGTYSFAIPAGFASGTYTVQVRDHTAPTIAGSAANFVVSAWTPETLAVSPGASAVFEFNANNTSEVAPGSTGAVSRVTNSVDSSQYLTAMTGSAANPIVVANNSGANGTSRVLQFHATKSSPNNADPTTDWLSAGGVTGAAGSKLVDLANSTDLSTNGSFTTIIAMDIDKSYSYEAGPIWGSLASPGPLQYAQLRANVGSGVQGADIVDSNLVGTPTKTGTVTAGWHVLTMIKTGNALIYRLDGTVVSSVAITSNAAFTAKDFMIGGGFPPSSSTSAGAENGVAAPYVGEFQAYGGVLQGSDLANAEKLAGNSIGLTLNPTVPSVPTIALAAPGTVQEASVGAGVTITESVATTGLSGSIYEEVLTANGAVESAFQAVTLGTNGTASFSVHLAKSGDVIKAVDNTASPTVTAISAPVTITDPTPAAKFAAILPSPLYTGVQTVTGTGGVAGLQLERITQGTYNAPGQAGWVAATVAPNGTWSVQLTFTKPGMLAHVYAENGGSTSVVDLVDGTPNNPPAAIPTIAVSAPGTVQEASAGAGVTVIETVTTTNLSGSVYEEVLTAAGAVETGFQAVPLTANGSASFSVHLAKSGDFVRVADNATTPSVTANSAPVTITDPTPSYQIALSAPGTIQEASVGAGVTVSETVTTAGGLGTIYEEVLTSAGMVESAFQPVTIGSGGTATFSVHLAKSGDFIRAVDNTTNPSVSATSAAVTITDPAPPPPAQTPLAATLPNPLYTGVQTVTGTGGVAGLQLERITQGTYNAPGQSGWVTATVAPNGTWSAQLTFTKPGMLAHVYAENGGSTSVVDLVNGTPGNPPSMSRLAATMQSSIASDMVARAAGSGSAPSPVPPAVASAGAQISILGVHTAALSVPDQIKVAHIS